MIISNAPRLGFSVSDIAKGVYSVASNTRVQQAAAAAAQAYAPGQYATAMQWADRARGIAPVPPAVPAPPPVVPAPPPPSDDTPDPDGAPVVRKIGVQKNNFTPFIIGGGILVLAVLLLRR